MRIRRIAFISALIAAVVAALKIKQSKEAESTGGDDTSSAEPSGSADSSDA